MSDDPDPSYRQLFKSGELARRVETAFSRLRTCDICPRQCGINRLDNVQKGACHTGEFAVVASYGAHFGEEKPLRGYSGSGTIFFSWCNMNCVYCQNADISQHGTGQELSPLELSAMMLKLQAEGCHNINLVSPSHVVPQILAALLIAAAGGLNIPLVYNSGGYDSLKTLELLEGIVDIYMPDMKYANSDTAQRLSGIPDYVRINRQAIQEMHRQVGDLLLDSRGIAVKGLLVRHLVLPERLAGSESIFEFIASQISKNTYLNIMDQYRPAFQTGRLSKYPELGRRINTQEYSEAVQWAFQAGLNRLDA